MNALDPDAPASAENANIKVMVRLRPPDYEENIRETYNFPSDNPQVLTIKDPLSRGRMEHSYTFNKVFMPHSSQEEVFNTMGKPLVDHILNGFNSCVFAYGQTGSGKSYSVFGEGAGTRRGILPRAIEYLFEKIEQRAEHKEVGIVVSFLEIYLDQVRDLGKAYLDKQWKPPHLQNDEEQAYPVGAAGSARSAVRSGGMRPMSAQARTSTAPVRTGSRPGSAASQRPGSAQSRQSRPDRPSSAGAQLQPPQAFENMDLEIHEAPNGHVFVKDLTLVPVKNITEVLDVINLGVGLRATHETRMNATSSRSHTIFSVNVVQKDRRMPDAEVLSGVLNLCDLAGSERLARSQSEGRRFQEAVIINSSLSALGKVVLNLAARNTKYIPYRDSKLTRILQSSLGGNSHTTLLCCINPSMDNYEESLNALQFAERCKNVLNRPTVNYVDPTSQTQDRRIRRLLAEIADLKEQLEVSKASLDNRLSFMTENLGVGQGAPEAIKNLERDAHQDKGYQESLKQQHKDFERRLAAERDKRMAAQRKADEALAKFEAAHQEMQSRDEERRREVIALREKADALDRGNKSKDEMWVIERARHEANNRDNLTAEHARAHALLSEKDKLLLNIPKEMKHAKALLDQKEKVWLAEKHGLLNRHHKEVEDITTSHKETLANTEKQYSFWMQKKEEETATFVGEFDEHRDRTKKEIKRYREELVGLFDLVQQLSKIIQDLENGTYPTQYKCGVQCVQLPYGVKAKLPTEKTFEKLFLALADTKVKCNRYTSMVANMQPQARRSGLENWDADKFARDYVRVAAQTAAVESEPYGSSEAALTHLDRDQLVLLASTLKNLCITSNGLEQEKAALRDQVLQELSSHPTVEYIRHLEQELAAKGIRHKQSEAVPKPVHLQL